MRRGKAMSETAGNEGGRRGIPWRWIGWGGAGALLLVPLVAMQFTDEVNWTAFDFAFMGGLMGLIGLGLELAARRTGDAAYRIGVAMALAASFLLVWINGAVGIIGDEGQAPNWLFMVVIAVAFLGAIAAAFEPAGMAWAMRAAALVQIAVPFVAWAYWPLLRPAVLAREVIGSTVVFTAIWLTAAVLFRKAARRG